MKSVPLCKTPVFRTSEQAHKVGDGDVIAPHVHLHVVAIEVNVMVGVGIDGPRQRVARAACYVIGEHEDDAAVWNAQAVMRVEWHKCCSGVERTA